MLLCVLVILYAAVSSHCDDVGGLCHINPFFHFKLPFQHIVIFCSLVWKMFLGHLGHLKPSVYTP